ncbi:Phospholipid-transporting ATPase 3 [Hondaea fermentalgiana]|uniref:Phospholipid-transporting ATPase 3 n=1 Tax=Hondaea fermentalgiana TaxID=2315210 RepID=A0A2R5GD77_9STRA|nr:Phospholipid-transporting ATPase 3 [Hondaea fermentalgiana]|eukprot:GBG26583.1 Phospholipid-transporting ATPase 3 [Hondaea fermentalgiana]
MLVLVSSFALVDPCIYVETANIDGETYLKRAFTVPKLVSLVTGETSAENDESLDADAFQEVKVDPVHLVTTFKGARVSYEAPSHSLSSMSGEMVLSSLPGEAPTTIKFGARNMLYRGAVVRNVKWVIGIVLYTGKETKVLMADAGSVEKQSKVERSVNQIIITVLVFLVVILLLSELLHFINPWAASTQLWYMRHTPEASGFIFPRWLAQFCQNLILFKNLLPILLYAVQEGLSQVQANVYIRNDRNMYCPDANRTARCNTTSLAQEIGQIDWIFSDKTGTLTKNEMRLVAFDVGERRFGVVQRNRLAELDREVATMHASSSFFTRAAFADLIQAGRKSPEDSSNNLSRVNRFLRVLAVCHTVLIDPDNSAEVDIRTMKSIDGASAAFFESESSSTAGGRADSTVRIRKAYAAPVEDETIMLSRSESSQLLDTASGGRARISDHVVYDAESPDEEALVSGAAALGIEFVATQGQNVVCLMCKDIGSSSQTFEKWQILAVNPFSSRRKRMSVVVREPDGERRIMLLCKGADNQVLRVTEHFPGAASRNSVEDHLRTYARAGLRTLVVAQRVLDMASFQTWMADVYRPAVAADPAAREERIHDAACAIEQGLEYLGITCVEDRLQEDVPETIATLRTAGIPLWVITGDKVETAIDIGNSVQLLREDSTTWHLTTNTVKEPAFETELNPEIVTVVPAGIGAGRGAGMPARISRRIQAIMRRQERNASGVTSRLLARRRSSAVLSTESSSDVHWMASCKTALQQSLSFVIGLGAIFAPRSRASSAEFPRHALVVEGDVLKHFLGVRGKENVQSEFLELARRCGVVLACRASPAQKAELVRLVMNGVHPRPTTLAIGDGTNDVPMIQAASVGVGISGREGTHATTAADFSIARFQFLAPLMLVHGRLGYMRMGKATLLVFYGNIMFTWTTFLVGTFSMFSGASIFDDMMLTLVNVFVAVPVFMLGFFDTDVVPVYAQRDRPELYAQGPRNRYLNRRIADLYMLRGIAHALIAFPLIAYCRPDGSLDSLTTHLYVCLIFILTLRSALSASSYTWPFVLGIAFNVGFVLSLSVLVDVRALREAQFFHGNARVAWNINWTVVFLIVTLDVVGPLAWFYIRSNYFVTDERQANRPGSDAVRPIASIDMMADSGYKAETSVAPATGTTMDNSHLVAPRRHSEGSTSTGSASSSISSGSSTRSDLGVRNLDIIPE